MMMHHKKKHHKKDKSAKNEEAALDLAERVRSMPTESLAALRELIDHALLERTELEDDEAMEEEPLPTHDELLDGVLRIYATSSEPSLAMPWQRRAQQYSTASGFVIQGRLIVTNAHAVSWASIVQVQKRNADSRVVARVVAIGHVCDLALLTVDDESFWDGLKELEFGDLPELQDGVSVLGYPIGGETLSISSGVVSRIEVQEYAQAGAELLALQIDAAINPGNSGGPVVNMDGFVVGVAFQSLSADEAEAVGYVIPVTVLRHFMSSALTKEGFALPELGIGIQSVQSKALQRHLSLVHDGTTAKTGVRVTEVRPIGSSAGKILQGDVLLKIDDLNIGSDGLVPFPGAGNVTIGFYVAQRCLGDVVHINLLRDGRSTDVSVTLTRDYPLIPRALQKGGISYCVFGGLVFQTLTREFLAEIMGGLAALGSALELISSDLYLMSLGGKGATSIDEEVVILSQVLAHAAVLGYESLRLLQLRSVNGRIIKNMKQVTEVLNSLEQWTDEFIVFDFVEGVRVALDRKQVLTAQADILKTHGISDAFVLF